MRYLLLVLLNLPIVLVALLNAVTQYKLGRSSSRRFEGQVILWGILLVTLVGAFPIYNLLIDAPIFDAHELTILDIVQTTGIVYLFYIANDFRRKNERSERTIRELHQELSIKLSQDLNGKN